MNKEKLIDYLLAEYNKRDISKQYVKNFFHNLPIDIRHNDKFNKNDFIDYLYKKLIASNKSDIITKNLNHIILELIVKIAKGEIKFYNVK